MKAAHRMRHPETADLLKGLVAGVVGGIAGAWAMNRFHAAVSSLSDSPDDEAQQAGEQEPGDAQAAERGKQQGGEPTTVLAAEAISERVFHHPLTDHEKKLAGPAMHYGFGACVGSVYGVAAEYVPMITTGSGTAYGTAVWLAADEAAVPALGLAPPPTQHPASTHLSALGAHLVYGLITESTRRLVRQLL